MHLHFWLEPTSTGSLPASAGRQPPAYGSMLPLWSGWPLSPENEDCGLPGFIFCPGAGMWKRHSQTENGSTWAESQSRPSCSVILSHAIHPFPCPLPSSSASEAPGSLWHKCTHTHAAQMAGHTVGPAWPLLASPWVGEWPVQVSF